MRMRASGKSQARDRKQSSPPPPILEGYSYDLHCVKPNHCAMGKTYTELENMRKVPTKPVHDACILFSPQAVYLTIDPMTSSLPQFAMQRQLARQCLQTPEQFNNICQSPVMSLRHGVGNFVFEDLSWSTLNAELGRATKRRFGWRETRYPFTACLFSFVFSSLIKFDLSGHN